MQNFSIRTTERQFSAAEVEMITGVTGTTQRDWRRRGFLSAIVGGGRAQYSLGDLIEIAALGTLAKAGLPVSHAARLASMAVLPVLANFDRWDDVTVFLGDPLTEDAMARVRQGRVVGASDDDNWLFAVLDGDRPEMGRTSDLRKLDGLLRGATCAIILDLTSLAHGIVRKAALPLITVHVEAKV